MARPSLYTPEIINEICERLGNGEPMAQICRDDHMPSARTVRDWVNTKPDVSAAIACAREEGEDIIAARLRDTARGRGESTQDVQRDKLIIDTDLKLLAKWNPKKWGDKTTLAGDTENPIAITEVVRRVVRPDNRDA